MIPTQRNGKQVDVVEQKVASGRQEAQMSFKDAVKRLLDVNRWQDISQGLSSTFVLTAPDGEKKDGSPDVGSG